MSEPSTEQIAASIGCDPQDVIKTVRNKIKSEQREDDRSVYTSFVVDREDLDSALVFETLWPQTELELFIADATRNGWEVEAQNAEESRWFVTVPGKAHSSIHTFVADEKLVMTAHWCYDVEQGEYDDSEVQPFDREAAKAYLHGDVLAVKW